MGLSNEGLIVIVAITTAIVVFAHYMVVVRSIRLVTTVDDPTTVNLVSLVAYGLILALYVIGCTLSIFAASQDTESNGWAGIGVAAEFIWLMSPVIAALSLWRVNRGVFSKAFRIFPNSIDGLKLCVKRAFLFGIPFCAVYAAGDQVVRQLLQLVITGNADYPVAVNDDFLEHVGDVFGYNGGDRWVSFMIGIASNFSMGPFVDLFAPACDSVFDFQKSAGTGIALYFLYAIPEEIGWTGCMYPLLLGYYVDRDRGGSKKIALVKAIGVTGLVWGFWHTPLIVLRWNPELDNISAVLFDALFILGAVAARFVLISFVWPIRVGQSLAGGSSGDELLTPRIVSPSMFPAIFAHAAMNVWWQFYNKLYIWIDGWSLLTGSEFSLTAIIWQTVMALLVVRRGLQETD
jgi:hypothetical protein